MASFQEHFVRIRDKVVEVWNNTINKFITGLFKKNSSIIFLGIDNAGKTTLVNKLKYNSNHVFLPTRHATREVVEIGKLKAYILDVGGHQAARIAWKDYLHGVDAIVFIVDVTDEQRFEEVREAWLTVLDITKDVPVLVLMNKIDLLGEDSRSIKANHGCTTAIEEATQVKSTCKDRNISIRYISIVNENTYNKDSELCLGFEWLSQQIDSRRESERS